MLHVWYVHVARVVRACCTLCFNFQLIDVGELNGRGETEPRRYFYQNLAEAEYVVHLFMYMRLLGYPAHRISLLTTYNGQKELLRDVVEQRCANNPLFGRPHKISTVDKYQGQQNDYILLSLVKTKAVGHLRDVRRLVVAMSRARLGLYVFGRVALFRSCYELQPAFQLLCQRPLQLHLVSGEYHPCTRGSDERPPMQQLDQQQQQQQPAAAADQLPPAVTVAVDDVLHMSNLVQQLYSDVCSAMSAVMQQQKAPGEMEARELPKDTGAKYDSDEEAMQEEDPQAGMIVNEVEDEAMEAQAS